MPLAESPGRATGAMTACYLFAPEASYGQPDDLKRLIDAAHRRGLMVFLDVVYNHFGPEGNYLSQYAAPFFTDRHHTPWGAAINYDGEDSRVVRDFIVHNALYWLEEYQCRRAAPRRRARDHRRQQAAYPDRDRRGGAQSRDRPPCPSRARERRQRGAAACARAEDGRRFDRAVERRPPPRAACRCDRRVRRLLSRLRDDPIGASRPRAGRGLCLSGRSLGASRRRAARRAAARICRRPPSSRSCRTTTRSATARSASASTTSRRSRRPAPPPRSSCWRRRRRCCSWARNGRRRRRSCSSAISAASWPRRCARGGAPSSPSSRRSRAPRRAPGSPIQRHSRRS